MTLSKLVIIIPMTVFIFAYGVSVGHYKIFPFDDLQTLKTMLIYTDLKQKDNLEISQNMSEINQLIHINNENDIMQKRKEMINYIWLSEGLPNRLPTKIQTGITDSLFADLNNLKQINSITVEMEYGASSTSYLFLSNESNNKVVLYHQGHGEQSFNDDKRIIQFFLNNNYSIMMFSMPNHGMNKEPIMESDRFGTLKLKSHDHFRLIESSTFHPIKYFFEPIVVSLNYLEQEFSFDSYNMLGLSGGGWSTIVYTALDPRISHSYSVAGSFPLWLRENPNALGDYEQYLPDFYKIANYEELYMMGAFGEQRKLVLIYNEFDPCCFSGQNYDKFPFGAIIKSKLAEMENGEHFDVIIDNTNTKHTISDTMLSQITRMMEE